MIYGAVNQDGFVFATLETTGAMPAGYIPIDSHDKIGWRYIDGEFSLRFIPHPPQLQASRAASSNKDSPGSDCEQLLKRRLQRQTKTPKTGTPIR